MLKRLTAKREKKKAGPSHRGDKGKKMEKLSTSVP